LQPDLQIGPLELKTFGLCFAAGFIAAAAVLARHLKELGKPVDWAYEMIFAALVGGVIGSRVDYLLQNWDKVSDDFFGNVFSGSGLVWFGGLVGGAVGVVLWAWRRGFLGLQLLDVCAAPLALGYALGRVGCFLVNDDYGIPSSLPWAMKFPAGLPPTTVMNLQAMGVKFPAGTDPMQVVAVHPTQIYETVFMLLVFWWLWRRRGHLHSTGWLWAWYMVFAGIERFLVELVRAKDDRFLGPFTLAQATSVMLIVVGGALLLKWREPGPQAFPESLRPKEAAVRGGV